MLSDSQTFKSLSVVPAVSTPTLLSTYPHKRTRSHVV